MKQGKPPLGCFHRGTAIADLNELQRMNWLLEEIRVIPKTQAIRVHDVVIDTVLA